LKGSGRTIVKYRDTAVICGNTAEPIQVLFMLWGRMGSRHHALDGVQFPQRVGAIVVEWIGAPIVKYRHFLT